MAIPATIAVVRIARFAPTPINKPPMKLGTNGQIMSIEKASKEKQTRSRSRDLRSSTLRSGAHLDGVVSQRPMPLRHRTDARGASLANDSDILGR